MRPDAGNRGGIYRDAGGARATRVAEAARGRRRAGGAPWTWTWTWDLDLDFDFDFDLELVVRVVEDQD